MTTADAITPTVRQRFRRLRFWIVVAVVVVLISLVTLLAGGRSAGADFDPDAAGPGGARALREVLQQQGVAVDVVDRSSAAATGGGTLLVDGGATALPRAVWQRLEAARGRIVVVSPDAVALRELLPGTLLAGYPSRARVTAGCALALAVRAGAMDLDGVGRSLRAPGATVCFRDARGAGQLVTGRAGSTRVVLLADRTAFTNEHIAHDGNAAVALSALGAVDHLTWYRPDPAEFVTVATLQQLTPPWVTPVVALLLAAGVGAALWRGRRLGPIVVERLPVTVRSRETVEGRARLYERGRAQLRAADALRIGALDRLAPLAGLSRTATVQEVAEAAARITGRRREEVEAVLLTEQPGSDRDLLRISDDLARLEAAVRAATVPGTEPRKGTP